jgi:hypothetical protein
MFSSAPYSHTPSAYVPLSKSETKYHAHIKWQKKWYIFGYPTGRQKIHLRLIASFPWVQSARTFFMNAIFICQCCSQILYVCHTVKGFIYDFCAVILYSHDANIHLVVSAFVPTIISLRVTIKFLCWDLLKHFASGSTALPPPPLPTPYINPIGWHHTT